MRVSFFSLAGLEPAFARNRSMARFCSNFLFLLPSSGALRSTALAFLGIAWCPWQMLAPVLLFRNFLLLAEDADFFLTQLSSSSGTFEL